jgi:hypothetical protein
MTFLLRINDHPYYVDDDAVEQIQSRILEAIRAGGEFIDVIRAGGRTAKALVTLGSAIHLERLPEPIRSSDEAEDFPLLTFYDLDFEL